MNLQEPSSRKLIYTLLIVIAAATAAGHVCSATRVFDPDSFKDDANPDPRRTNAWPASRPKPTPAFGSNDISRWATIRALLEEGTYVIGRRYPGPGNDYTTGYTDIGITFEPGNAWRTIDKVLKEQETPEHYKEFYSSKPPLLTTVVAGLCWVLQLLFGWTLKDNTFTVVRTVLLLINIIPFMIYLRLLACILERRGGTDWGRLFILAAAAFGTLVSPFLVTFNNHTIATWCVLFALYPVIHTLNMPWQRSDTSPSASALAISGLFAGLTAAIELPAASFTALLFLLLLRQAPRRTLLFFLPMCLVPYAAELGLNYVAIGEWEFAYSKFGGPWYEYAGSAWIKPKEGETKYTVDFAYMHESKTTYAFHVLLGHHGLFSLAPIWVLAFLGMAMTAFGYRLSAIGTEQLDGRQPIADSRKPFALLTLAVSVIVIGFYLVKTSNYGGGTSGMRWFMWMTPLWLLTMAPVVDWLAERRWGRWLALACLAVSIFSANYPTWNPWRHPWLYDLLDSGGYIPY